MFFFSGCAAHRQEAAKPVGLETEEPREYYPGSGLFRPGSEPLGFRGITWGTDISQVGGLILHSEEEELESAIYTREGEPKRLGGIEISDIYYGFWKDKLWEVVVVVRGGENFSRLTEAVFNDYGQGMGSEPYFWKGDITLMELGYIRASDVGVLALYSIGLYEELKEWSEKVRPQTIR